VAIKPTIYKFRINLSDLNRDYYDALNLTVAQHPSETIERMMAKVMAYCIEAREGLSFSKGLSDVEEPDIWVPVSVGKAPIWIELGEPASDRIKKATRLADDVAVYAFNTKAETWWSINQARVTRESARARVVLFNFSEIEAFAALLERTMDLSITITGHSAFIGAATGECELNWQTLQ
jgi:uncharacterized protein YaeQ